MERMDGSDTIDRTEELCKLFTSTVSSLSADSEALKQLLSLKLVIGMDGHDGEERNDENTNPNIAAPAQPGIKRRINDSQSAVAIENLHEIESSVSELEQKMKFLQGMVVDEQRALKELEAVKRAAEAQRDVLQHMVHECDDLHLPGDEVDSQIISSYSLPQHDHLQQNSKKDARRHIKRSKRHDLASIKISPITENELNNLSRNTRGRISLMELNFALEDIEAVCKNKYEVLYHHSQPKEQHMHSGRTQYIERQYRQTLLDHRELQTDEHGDHLWVAEQDLRQHCAFFRNGESTARAMLSILRCLKRLKQVPGKKLSEVTYMLLCD